ncbi:hypothetical protein [Symbiopectobacterium purcellii]|uniref:hypothetical protein n=1 Tax=Symbiopectobacterium purcellii TaxID=2871826 RepID=UPI003F86EB73
MTHKKLPDRLLPMSEWLRSCFCGSVARQYACCGVSNHHFDRGKTIAKRHYFDNSQLCFFAAYQGIGCNHF